MGPIEWQIADRAVDYEHAVTAMERRVGRIREGAESELVWLVEHPPIYTAGTSAEPGELTNAHRFPVYRTGRGGRYTYHGPGQRVAYVMLDLRARGPDLRAYVRDLEQWMIDTVADFGVRASRREGRIGVWVMRDGNRDAKIGALGVRVRRWVTFHGVSLNIEPKLDHYDGIVPCGLEGFDVTSLVDLGVPATMNDVDTRLRVHFERIFGLTVASGGRPD